MSEPNPVIIYTDGGCFPNPGNGGWSAILRYGEHGKELSGRLRNTTNNRMEMLAAISALEALTRPCRVEIFTDSEYLRNGVTQWVQGWQRRNWLTADKKPVKNRDLWIRLLAAIERHQSAGGVQWSWTRGHAGDPLNERADQLANEAAHAVTDADPMDQGLSIPLANQSLFGD